MSNPNRISGRLTSILAAALLGAFILVGCSQSENTGDGSGNKGGSPGSTAGGTAGGAGGTAGDPGAAVFGRNCAGCHGAQGQGGKGPALASIKARAASDLEAVVKNGKGRMPAFGGRLSDAEIASVVKHIKSMP